MAKKSKKVEQDAPERAEAVMGERPCATCDNKASTFCDGCGDEHAHYKAIASKAEVKTAPVQKDLDGKDAQIPFSVDEEDFTNITFESGLWKLKVRADKLEEIVGRDSTRGLVQKKLRGDKALYPLLPGVFDREVERFTDRLMKYKRAS